MTPTGSESRQLALLLGSRDYLGALGYLNSLAGYRFTALYRRDDPHLWNVVLFDAEHPHRPQFPPVHGDETYCSMAMRERDAFVVGDALADPRLGAHPARATVRAYCGAPLIDAAGEPFGTICHFDFVPVAAPPEAVELLVEVSRLLDPQALVDALEADLGERVIKLRQLLPLLAASLCEQDSWRDAFEAYAEPIRALLHRLGPAPHTALAGRLDALWLEFESMRSPL